MKNSVWNRINSAILFIDFKSIDEIVAWREALNLVGLNINDCQIVCFIKNKKERTVLKEMSFVTFLAENDLKLFGKIGYDDAKKVLEAKYDAGFWIGDHPKKMNKPISKLNAHVKVGINSESHDFDIKLDTKEIKPEQIVKFVRNTLERIS